MVNRLQKAGFLEVLLYKNQYQEMHVNYLALT